MDTIFILNTSMRVVDVLSNNGDNPSAPFFDDTYKQELSTGAETYEFTTIANSRTSEVLVIGNYILFKYDGKYKLFQIMEVTDEHSDGKRLISIYSEMAGMKLLNDYCEPFRIEGNFITFLEKVLQDTDWQAGNYDEALLDNIQTVNVSDYENVYSLIQENIDTYGGVEIEFRVEFTGNTLTGRYIDAYSNGERGNKAYKRFEYGENVKGITRTINMDDFATAVIGTGSNNATIKEAEWEYKMGDPADKPLNQAFVADTKANDKWNNGEKYIKTVYKSDSSIPLEILQESWDYLQEINKPKFDYEVDLALTTKDYEEIRIGDTDYVIDNSYNPPILLEARVSELEISFTDPTSNKCTLSNYKEVRSSLLPYEQEVASRNILPNPSALVSLGKWTPAGTAGAYITRYELVEHYLPAEAETKEEPYKVNEDPFGHSVVFCIALGGGGLSMIIVDGSGKVIMIDGGYASDTQTIKALTDLGITYINTYIVTHCHTDHGEVVPTILSRFGVENLYIKESNWAALPPVEIEWGTEAVYDSIIAKCNELGVQVHDPVVDAYIKISENSNIKIFNAGSQNYRDYNMQSLMCLYTYKGNKFFFAGDGMAEAALSPLNQVGKVDLLQLGHHGEGSWPQDQKLIDELQPKYAYFASDFLDKAFNGGTDPINTTVSLDRVSFWGGYGVTHGSHSNPGNVAFVLDGINITTTANAIKSTSRWYLRDGEYYYFKSDSTLAVNEWKEINSKWYRFGEDKIMYRNKWFQDHDRNDNWFYLGDDGAMYHDRWFQDPNNNNSWYYFGSNGAMYKDTTVTINGKQYTFNSDGVCTNPDV